MPFRKSICCQAIDKHSQVTRSSDHECQQKDRSLQVLVRDNNVDQALRVLKKRMQREGLFREIKARMAYEKPSEKRAREKAEGIARHRKLARKKLQREGLIPGPKKAVYTRDGAANKA
jgi:small subunit ribosomal protein S21